MARCSPTRQSLNCSMQLCASGDHGPESLGSELPSTLRPNPARRCVFLSCSSLNLFVYFVVVIQLFQIFSTLAFTLVAAKALGQGDGDLDLRCIAWRTRNICRLWVSARVTPGQDQDNPGHQFPTSFSWPASITGPLLN